MMNLVAGLIFGSSMTLASTVMYYTGDPGLSRLSVLSLYLLGIYCILFFLHQCYDDSDIK